MAVHSSILTWEIPWMGSQGHKESVMTKQLNNNSFFSTIVFIFFVLICKSSLYLCLVCVLQVFPPVCLSFNFDSSVFC